MLELKNIDASYGFLQILWGVTLEVGDGEFVGLVGPNGAGKTTTLRTIAGLLNPSGGEVLFNGERMNNVPAHMATRKGISYISEDLNLFVEMSVRDNLLMGAYTIQDRDVQLETLDFVFELFPRLKERQSQLAGTMSGGERKMLAIARGLMSNPELLLVDEPSLGLAPHLVTDVFNSLQRLQKEGVTILLVEQRVNATLEITDRAYVLEQGKIAMEGLSSELITNQHVKNAYLGI
ncbi:MAG: ABC transporter ATP-binding protein [Anaerolineae bacterium]|nr:ABC transporter ATP-binding protein [Anaerolineae bacterium]